ncbi:PREDICTED: rac GTPase-activating protein 1-like [Vollenhovia emeryi]|uniref:rac GTPase-activating protein 1-like n=1 Tax=Vollenhovia emeryi TaxID=411798 RepID=UPI0005F4A7EC|nr:PREDICTED: rac GTPase-activating protein 1-like [Vollenhovia emeryi]
MTSSLARNQLNEVLTQVPQVTCLPLQEYRQLCSDLERIRRESASLGQKLCHARRNLEEEKRKRRVMEHHKNLLERQLNMARKILFDDGGANLSKDMKEKLQFLNTPEIDLKYNNVNVQDERGDRHLATIAETDSTGSILSDLNCLSKSEDDLDTDIIIKTGRKKQWREYKASGEHLTKRQCGTLEKIAEFNLLDRSNSAGVTARMEERDFAVKTQVAPEENIDCKVSNVKAIHSFISKIVIKPETCTLCGKRIRFGKLALKCRDCPVTCHTECRIHVTSVACVCRKSR